MGRKQRQLKGQSEEGGTSQPTMGRKGQLEGQTEEGDTSQLVQFVWVKLKNCPMWPAKIIKQLSSTKLLCSVKSDDSEFPVNVTDTVPFQEHLNKLKNNGIGKLTKKRQMNMLNDFQSDVEWVLWEMYNGSVTGLGPDDQQETTVNSPKSVTGPELDGQQQTTVTSPESVTEHYDQQQTTVSSQKSMTGSEPYNPQQTIVSSPESVTGHGPDNFVEAMSFDNEEDLDSSGSEWKPRESDASEVSESTNESDKNSDVWPYLTKDRFITRNSENLCTITSQTKNPENGYIHINSDESEEELLDEKRLERDLENPKFYIRAVLRSDITKTGKLKKRDRVYNTYQYCEVCNKRLSNFARHVRNKDIHKNCPEIMALKKETDHKKRDALRTILRGKYNHRYNMKSIKRGHGEIILERRPVGKFHLMDFGPCPNCYLWISKRQLTKHQKSCSVTKALDTSSSSFTTSSSLITQSDTLSGRITDMASKPLVNEVFAKMNLDTVGKIARNDPLIIHLGSLWMQKNVVELCTLES